MATLPSLRQLSYLVTLSETLHFTEAARRSFVTQSTLSGGIMELERLLGGVLVERDRQNVRLTPLGEQVVERSRVLLADAQDLMRMSREMSEPLTGDIHLGIIPTIAPFLLTELLVRIQQELPKVRLYLHEVQTEKAIEELEYSRLDMVILALPFDTRSLKVAEIAKEKLFLVANKNNTLAQKATSFQDLDLSQLILLDEGHCLRDHALSACPINEQRKNDQRLQASSLPTLVEMVSANLGYTLLPEISLNSLVKPVQDKLFIKDLNDTPTRSLALVTRKSTPLQNEFDVILNIFKDISQNLLGQH